MNNKNFVLGDTAVDFFHTHGFLVIENATPAEEVSKIRKVYDQLFSERAGRKEGNQYDLAGADEEDKPAVLPQIVNPISYAPELEDLVFRNNSAAIGKQLLGPDIEFQGEHAIMKPPEIGQAAPWHQDEAYWKGDLEYNSISVWLALQDTTIENGCMQFIPGSHNQEVLPHRTIGHNPRIHGLEVIAEDVDLSDAIACPVPAGGATIHHCRTLHYTGPNQTGDIRRAYIHTWASPYRKRNVARDFYWQKTRETARDERRRKAGTVSVSSGSTPK